MTRKPRPQVDPAQYRVRGFVVNLGDDLPPRKRNAALRALREQVPEFAKVVDARALSRAHPLGAGAADLLVPIARGAQVDVRAAWNIVHALLREPRVADAEPAVRTPSGTAPPPHRPSFGAAEPAPLPQARDPAWSVDNARIRAAWPRSRGAGIVVAHPDTGYTRHPQIDSPRLRVADGWDFEDDKADPLDPLEGSYAGHGTATASVIMADATPAPGVFGAAPQAQLVPYRVSDSVVHFDFTNLTQALYRARELRCDLVSMSLGGPWAGRALGRAVDALVDDGMILLAAAGNVWPFVVYPAKFDDVVACAASNAADRPWKESASGDEVDISAPGESVWRAAVRLAGSVAEFSVAPSSGTSYAVATTAGACALWLALHGARTLRARYGARLAAVFLQLLGAAGFRKIASWKTAAYGPGILDASALLAAQLPAQPPARAPRPARLPIARSERAYAWARLQPYFPELAPDELARAIVPAFGARSLSATRRLADVIDEVEFFVATDPGVRSSIVAAAAGKRAVRRTSASPRRTALRHAVAPPATPSARSALRAVGSAQLRSRLID